MRIRLEYNPADAFWYAEIIGHNLGLAEIRESDLKPDRALDKVFRRATEHGIDVPGARRASFSREDISRMDIPHAKSAIDRLRAVAGEMEEKITLNAEAYHHEFRESRALMDTISRSLGLSE